jgi:two-component sensor histidine kinase/CHASE1-domain containing sensor protein
MQTAIKNRNIIASIIFMIGIVISISSFFLLNNFKINSNKVLTEQAIRDTNKKISNELKNITLTISSLQLLFRTNAYIDRALFHEFTAPFSEGLPGIKALEWAPQVIDSSRASYEASMIADGYKGFQIMQLDSLEQSLIPAKKKDFYFPIHFISPILLNKMALGFDLSSSKDRYACIKNSYKTTGIAISPPLKLIQNKNGSKSFLVLQAVKKNGKEEGVILGVYNMTDFINTILKEELKLLDIRIYDKTTNYASMYSNASGRPLPVSEAIAANILRNHFEIDLGDKTWAIYYSPNKKTLAYPHLAISYAFLFFGILITFLLLLMIKGNTDSKIVLEEKVKDRTQKLKDSNKQQAILLKEIHHRVKNNLQVITSLLSLQSGNIEDDQTKEIFKVSQFRINAMAMLHEELYQSEDLSKIGYGKYLQKLVEHLISSIKGPDNNIDLSIDVPDTLQLNIDTAIPLGLLINEVITNSLKYGFKNQKQSVLYIKIIPETYPKFKLLIGDYGQGFSEEINYRTTKSLGLKLIHQLTRQLLGSVERNNNKKGVHYAINFKEIV